MPSVKAVLVVGFDASHMAFDGRTSENKSTLMLLLLLVSINTGSIRRLQTDGFGMANFR